MEFSLAVLDFHVKRLYSVHPIIHVAVFYTVTYLFHAIDEADQGAVLADGLLPCRPCIKEARVQHGEPPYGIQPIPSQRAAILAHAA